MRYCAHGNEVDGDCGPCLRTGLEATDPNPPNPLTFDDPHHWGTYLPYRSPHFKTHKTLAQAKAAVANVTRARRAYGRETQCHAYVYEYDHETGAWVELVHLPKGTDLDTNPWYQTKAKKKPIKGPSDKAVEAAIKSITEAGA